jgi:hydrogenase expression/formation protein HypD
VESDGRSAFAALPEAVVGHHVLVHAGFALNIVDEIEAQRMLDDLARMGELDKLHEVSGRIPRPALVRRLTQELKRTPPAPGRSWKSAAAKPIPSSNTVLDRLLPEGVTLVHGPGCPVCVTPGRIIDQAIPGRNAPRDPHLFWRHAPRAGKPGKPLVRQSQRRRRARGLFAQSDALALARANPDREVVFFAVGFETTAPAVAQAVLEAAQEKIKNFSVLAAHVLVPPALVALLESPDNRVQGFLAAGHVCAVMGYEEYEPLSARYRVPIVVTGFEPTDILEGVLMTVRQLEEGRHEVENQYARAVRREGNRAAQSLVAQVFQRTDRAWRGLGEIPASGLELSPQFARSTPPKNSRSKKPTRTNPPSAKAAPCSAGPSARQIAKRSGNRARRKTRSARPWFPAKGPARRTTATGWPECLNGNPPCPTPPTADRIQMGHGSGGRQTQKLIEEIFYPAFANDALLAKHDAAALSIENVQTRVHHRLVRHPPALFPRRRHRPTGGHRHAERPGHGRRAPSLFERRVYFGGRVGTLGP